MVYIMHRDSEWEYVSGCACVSMYVSLIFLTVYICESACLPIQVNEHESM